MVELLHIMQSHIKSLKTAWIDSMEWNDDKVGNDLQRVHVVIKQWMENSGQQKKYYDDLRRFVSELSNNSIISSIEHLVMDDEESVINLAFDIILDSSAKVVVL